MDQTGRSVARERALSPPFSKTTGHLGLNRLSGAIREEYYSDVYTLEKERSHSAPKFHSDNSLGKWPPDRVWAQDNVRDKHHLYDEIKEDVPNSDSLHDYELAKDMGVNQSKSYSFLKENGPGRNIRLLSSSRNKDNRPPAKVPIVIKKNSATVLSNNNDIEKKPPGDEEGHSIAHPKDSLPNRVRLGDYTQPVDATNFTWGRNDEYCEPYVAEQLIKEAAKRRQSDNKVSDNMDVNSESTDYNRINRKAPRESGQSQTKPISSGSGIHLGSDGYDHASSWTSIANKSSDSSHDTYEEPWDSRTRQRDLQSKLNRAQSEEIPKQFPLPDSRRSSQDPAAVRRKPQPSDMYEDAWDSPLKQKLLEEKLNAAKRGGGAASRSPTSPLPSSPPSTYEEPWDIKKRQMELEGRLEATHIHKSPIGTPISPSRRSPQPRPGLDTYEEAWDLKSGAKAVSYLRSTSQQDRDLAPSSPQSPNSGSPTNKLLPRLVTPATACTIGERINPIIPLHKQSWYQGRISRADAENTLRVCKEGSYLVRESESERGQYSLSIKSRIMNIHLRITKRSNGQFILGENSALFDTIPEMIDYYTQHQVPLKGTEHLTLLHPVDRH
ncbi:SH2 domain-containing adapter protein E-like [Haliotis cracherodii]|uniref:SH2 domain-containing adapter protein E-like n=1 Tax=Haliotis cracherodii TaxID=6455 RepID=UPI0039EC4951